MNVLIDKLPDTVMVSGIEIPINWDHRSGMKAHIALFDTDDSETFLEVMFPELPIFVEQDAASEAAAVFLMGAPTPALPGQKGRSSPPERAYSFLYDQESILAAFWQQYRIDLTQDTLHWWVFHALLRNLRDNRMADIMFQRTVEETSGMDDKERKRIRKNKARVALPEPVVEQKYKENLIACLKNGGVGLDGLLHGKS